MNSLSNISYKNTWCNPSVSNLMADSITVTDLAANDILLPSTNTAYTQGVIKINSKPYFNALDLSNGDTNIFVGADSGSDVQTNAAIRNSALGTNTLTALTTGANNTAVGNNALSTNTSGTSNVAVGYNTLLLNTSGNENVAVGLETLRANTTGGQNVAIGRQPLYTNTSGLGNIAIGNRPLFANTTGSANIALGLQALTNNITGTNNVAVGTQSCLTNSTGIENVAIGTSSLFGNSTGSSNVAIGSGSLSANTASNNTAVGASAGGSITTGTTITCVGRSAGLGITTGSNNTALGYNTMPTVTTGTFNLAIGANSGTSLGAASSNNVCIANIGNAADNNTIRIGTSSSHTNMYLASVVNCGNSSNNTEGIKLLNNVASYNATLLNYYEEYTFSITYSGAVNATTNNNKLTRIGNVVTLSLTGFTSAFVGSNQITAAAGTIPARFAPVTLVSVTFANIVVNNGAYTQGLVAISSLGALSFSQGAAYAAFTGAGNTGILDTDVTYIL